MRGLVIEVKKFPALGQHSSLEPVVVSFRSCVCVFTEERGGGIL